MMIWGWLAHELSSAGWHMNYHYFVRATRAEALKKIWLAHAIMII